MTAAARRLAGWGAGALLLAALCLSLPLCTRRALPPGVGLSPAPGALLAALGGSRGILAEAAWFRLNGLQREGRLAELSLLTDFIVALDPSNVEAWAFMAWNLAYNVSADAATPEARWRWVRAGIELLGRGLRANPGDPTLLRQLGWVWEHKVGGGVPDPALPGGYPPETLDLRARAAALPPPPDAAAFAAFLGAPPDWASPACRALHCYARAGHARDTLRALTLWLGALPPARRAALLPCFRRAVLAAWPELPPDQAERCRAVARELLRGHPGDPALQTLLKETAP